MTTDINFTVTDPEKQPAKSDTLVNSSCTCDKYEHTKTFTPDEYTAFLSTLSASELYDFLSWEQAGPNQKNWDKLQAQKKKKSPRKTVESRDPLDLPPWTEVQLTRQGDNYGEVLYMSGGFRGSLIKRLDAERYQIIKTGEIRYFSFNETKVKENLTKTFRELVGLVRANFTAGKDNQLFITLTYTENMTDPDEFFRDFDLFWKRVRYELKNHKLEYIAVAEPQGRGAWHMHIFVKSDQPVLYLDNKLLTEYLTVPVDPAKPDGPRKRVKDAKGNDIITGGLWGHGKTTSERLKGDDAGQYYAAYFTCVIKGSENGEEHFEDFEHQKGQKGLKNLSKKVIKGARIAMYPKYFKLYRCSRGIIRPKSEITKYEYVQEDFPIRTKASAINVLEGEKIANTMQRESFKKIETHESKKKKPTKKKPAKRKPKTNNKTINKK